MLRGHLNYSISYLASMINIPHSKYGLESFLLEPGKVQSHFLETQTSLKQIQEQRI